MFLQEKGTISDNSARGKRRVLWIVLFVVGLAVWTWFAAMDNTARAWRAVLVNFIFFTPLAAGLVTWSAVVLAANGRWMGSLEDLTRSGMAWSVPSVIVLGGLWASSATWAPWYGRTLDQGFWLSNTFIFARDLGVLIIFWLFAWAFVARRRRGRAGGKLRGVLIVVYAAAFSRIGFDLVMALDSHWYSTLFGMYFFVSGMYIAVTAWTLMAVLRGDADEDRRSDLATLVLAFSLLTAYMMYAQLLPIWYENLPEEVRFVIPRRNFFPWRGVSGALIAVVYLGPLLLLLTRWAKRTRWTLGAVAILVLAGLWVERWWLVAPGFHSALEYGPIEIAATAAFLGAFGLSFDFYRSRSSSSVTEEAGQP
jgi:hypothetical protein